MRLIRIVRLALAVCAVLAVLPRDAAADFLVEPFFAWSRNPPDPSGEGARWHPGGGVAAEWTQGTLIVGGEIAYAASFFDPTQDVFDLVQSSHLLSVSGQVGITAASMRERRFYPYATTGIGVLRQQARDRAGLIDVTRNDCAWNIGGGARLMVSDYLGIRADLRYFRDLQKPYAQPSDLVADLDRLAVWRVSIGAVLRFGD